VVTRGWLPQRAGMPGLNGNGAAAAVPQIMMMMIIMKKHGYTDGWMVLWLMQGFLVRTSDGITLA